LVLFWTALFMLSVGLQYVAAMAPQKALAINGAVFTSNFDGTGIDLNIYDSKGDVYLTGGPCQGGSHLEDGTYYYQVTSPNGVLLSSDAIGERKITVSGGFITTASGHVTHDVACTSSDGITVQLLPYDDTPNNGGEYKLTVGLASDVEACDAFANDDFNFVKDCKQIETKSDNYKVGPNGDLKVVKEVTGGEASGDFTVHIDCGADFEDDTKITFPDPGFVVIHDLPEGVECTVTETHVPAPPAGFTWGEPDISGSPATIKGDATVTVTVTNPLNEIPRTPSLTIEKSNDAPGVGETPLEAGDTVGFKLDYTLANGPVDNGKIEDVLPAGLTYVTGSATDSANGEFVFDGYDSATRTLTWVASGVGGVTENGSVTYEATVDEGAAELAQPLTNTACISSDQTDEDCAESDVFVGTPVLAETAPPGGKTAPPTDVAGVVDSSASGGSMLLVLLALAGIGLALVFVAPTPAAIRKRMR